MVGGDIMMLIRKLGLLFCGASALLLPVHVLAADESQSLDEIIVTAQKTSESIQRVPLAVTALSGESLQKTGVTDLSSLAAEVPNVNMGSQFGGARITIRGIGLEAISPGPEAPVAFNQDGVVISRTAGAMMGFSTWTVWKCCEGPRGRFTDAMRLVEQ